MRNAGRVFGLVLVVSLLGIAAYFWQNRYIVYDWVRLRDYQPSAAIEMIATDTSMNSTAKRLFYVQHPRLSDANEFNDNCGNNTSEQTIVLGCYISGQGIYIFDISDERLEGVEEVTAAHELLHAAYERLDESERQEVDSLTNQVFSRLNNERIRSAVENYRMRDPSVVPNELHSIIGTEIRNLPSELEEYYKRYFDDRSKIVNLAEEYEKVFVERKTTAQTLELQINSLKEEINQLEVELVAERSSLEKDRDQVSTQSEADSFNMRVRTYNLKVGQLNELIEEHNQLVHDYQKNALEQRELYDSLNSKKML